ncbi:Fc.00g110950.m01.CDS01 [Cosmosporella sp. VM-42]
MSPTKMVEEPTPIYYPTTLLDNPFSDIESLVPWIPDPLLRQAMLKSIRTAAKQMKWYVEAYEETTRFASQTMTLCQNMAKQLDAAPAKLDVIAAGLKRQLDQRAAAEERAAKRTRLTDDRVDNFKTVLAKLPRNSDEESKLRGLAEDVLSVKQAKELDEWWLEHFCKEESDRTLQPDQDDQS